MQQASNPLVALNSNNQLEKNVAAMKIATIVRVVFVLFIYLLPTIRISSIYLTWEVIADLSNVIYYW